MLKGTNCSLQHHKDQHFTDTLHTANKLTRYDINRMIVLSQPFFIQTSKWQGKKNSSETPYFNRFDQAINNQRLTFFSFACNCYSFFTSLSFILYCHCCNCNCNCNCCCWYNLFWFVFLMYLYRIENNG